VVVTLHRPSNVDNKEILSSITNFLIDVVAAHLPVLWPIHPRAAKQLESFRLYNRIWQSKQFALLHPIGYLEMLRLNMDAIMMFTDSGGLQEECTVLGTPCLTLRRNTERPITLREQGGASILVGNNIEKMKAEFRKSIKLQKNPIRPDLWDGKTAERCLEAILSYKE
jgi:UDP-N-acetylglucosamine 2-epimerase (non-hydrolysing)